MSSKCSFRDPQQGLECLRHLAVILVIFNITKEDTVKQERFSIKAETFHTSNYTGGNGQGLKHHPTSMQGKPPHTLRSMLQHSRKLH